MDTVSELINLLYDAASDVSRWQVFLDAYVRTLKARRGSMALTTGRQDGIAVASWSNWSDEDARLYLDQYAADDLYRIMASEMSEGTVRTTDGTFPRQLVEQSRAYREFYAPRNVYHGVVGVFIRTAGGSSGIIANRAKDDGPFGGPELAILRALMRISIERPCFTASFYHFVRNSPPLLDTSTAIPTRFS